MSETTTHAAEMQALWQWTLTPEATAACLVQDVFRAREQRGDENKEKAGEAEFYWVGRVPVRTVRLVGMVVGVQAYESRVVYSLDDGSGVMECQHRPPPEKGAGAAADGPKPVARLGEQAVVVGRIARHRDGKRVVVDSIEKCQDPNDEPRHWLAVRDLHATHYDIDEPFVVPARPLQPTPAPSTPRRTSATVSPRTPSTAASSPARASSVVPMSPHKLRHPSRLRSRDLTQNAFRIYVKHYMANVPPWSDPGPGTPKTPTQALRALGVDDTPRPARHTMPSSSSSFPHTPATSAETHGFTVSYLRRVPALALMAQKVAHAEWKRRALEAYNAAKARGERPAKPVPEKDPARRRARTKRLFVWAVQQLVKDGEVVSWEGPVRPALGPGLVSTQDGDVSLWRMDSSASTAGGDSTLFSNASSMADGEQDDGELSAPEDGEEAFVPLTPAFVAAAVGGAVRVLAARGKPADAQAVLRYLRRSDDMWRNLNEVVVQDALRLLGLAE
ncbi:Stn1 domain-containing protein [Mycena indigotica]|uniref:CST complex subunit STN1 n=1 Tax=Mycena indigotica TaxID=2126181 RepID=A0A8H6T6Z3_9AGAR|nr:Stn1 domain-containing protein [Mycena indigotica]KAF7311929.1 Stn1 domain-containing protein [Mycena indigotica]